MVSTYEPIYVELASESENPSVTEIDSLCLACNGQGVTKLLMTKIPHFKEIILMSFECNTCGYKNNSVQTSAWQEKGVSYELEVQNTEDFKRQIVTSGHCKVSIPEVELEIEPNGEKGEITTVEGVVQKVIANLEETKPQFCSEDLQNVTKFIEKLQALLDKEKFVLILDDPTGNSYVEDLNPSTKQLVKKDYRRSKQENEAIGIYEDTTIKEEDEETDFLREEVLSFDTVCDQCSSPSSTKMKVTKIPHFKEVIIMASDCSHCGYRTNEVKGGAGVSEKGRKISLTISQPIDMARDLLKSETCDIDIPELELHVGSGIVVGKFTTVEGLLIDVKNDLSKNPFLMGDSAEIDRKSKCLELVNKLDEIISGTMNATLILNDPAGNSYLQDICHPDPDPSLIVEDYERSWDQNEELGINDMKTENYTDDNNE